MGSKEVGEAHLILPFPQHGMDSVNLPKSTYDAKNDRIPRDMLPHIAGPGLQKWVRLYPETQESERDGSSYNCSTGEVLLFVRMCRRDALLMCQIEKQRSTIRSMERTQTLLMQSLEQRKRRQCSLVARNYSIVSVPSTALSDGSSWSDDSSGEDRNELGYQPNRRLLLTRKNSSYGDMLDTDAD